MRLVCSPGPPGFAGEATACATWGASGYSAGCVASPRDEELLDMAGVVPVLVVWSVLGTAVEKKGEEI
jgi:hypothetical protein